jgi:hypothetical protein
MLTLTQKWPLGSGTCKLKAEYHLKMHRALTERIDWELRHHLRF